MFVGVTKITPLTTVTKDKTGSSNTLDLDIHEIEF